MDEASERGTQRLLIYGAGGHAKSVIAIVERLPNWQVAGLIEDGITSPGRHVLGYQVVGDRGCLAALHASGIEHAFVAIGNNAARRELAQLLADAGFKFPALIDPAADVLKYARIGQGAFIHAQSIVGPEAVVGDHAVVSAMTVVGHDSVIGDYAQLAPGVRLGGGVQVGEMSFLGMGAVVFPRIRIGKNVSVSANAVVNHDLDDGVVVAGIPARVVRRQGE